MIISFPFIFIKYRIGAGLSLKSIFLGHSVILININVLMFQLYDHDKDGILNFKETQKVLRCLGLRVNEDQVCNYFSFSPLLYNRLLWQAKCLIKKVSADRYGFSVSFNEYLRLVSQQRRIEPDQHCLMECFRYQLQGVQKYITIYNRMTKNHIKLQGVLKPHKITACSYRVSKST